VGVVVQGKRVAGILQRSVVMKERRYTAAAGGVGAVVEVDGGRAEEEWAAPSAREGCGAGGLPGDV
jgi:hypothetical protein